MRCCLFVLVAIAAFVSGCGSSLQPVTGRVFLGDEAIAGATVTFSPIVESGSASGAVGLTDEQGDYVLRQVSGDGAAGVLCGDYKVCVSKQIDDWDGKSYMQSWILMQKVKKTTPKQLIPSDYTSTSTTPLSYQVVRGKNRFDIRVSP